MLSWPWKAASLIDIYAFPLTLRLTTFNKIEMFSIYPFDIVQKIMILNVYSRNANEGFSFILSIFLTENMQKRFLFNWDSISKE